MAGIKAFVPPRREFVSGEAYYFLGRPLRLKVENLTTNVKPSVHLVVSEFQKGYGDTTTVGGLGDCRQSPKG